MCISQLLQIGFSPDNCLFYDHLFRREKTLELRVYPEPIFNIHERFIFSLRKEMHAVVEIVWGSYVRRRLEKTCNLEKLSLWGEFKDVDIWLE